MPPSFVCVLECGIQDWALQGLESIQKCLEDLKNSTPESLFPNSSIDDMNYILFVSSPEENEINGVGPFTLPE